MEGIRLAGELAPCSIFSQAKGIHAATLHHTTTRAQVPIEPIHMDTTGPYPESPGGAQYALMFASSVSDLQRPNRTRGKSTATIFVVEERFVADIGVPHAFWTDNNSEYVNRIFAKYCDGLGIQRELLRPSRR